MSEVDGAGEERTRAEADDACEVDGAGEACDADDAGGAG